MKTRIGHIAYIFLLSALATLCPHDAESQNYDKQSDNQIGEKAIDFTFVADNSEQSLYRLIESRGTNVLVLFHSPECELCAKTKKKLKKSKTINRLLDEGSLTLLAVAVETDSLVWQQTCQELPQNWVNAYCKECEAIVKSYIYTVPTLFLIGKDGRVIDREFEHNEKNRYN